MRMTVYEADITGDPRPAAELAAPRWITGAEPDDRIAPAVRDHVPPLLRMVTSAATRNPRRAKPPAT